MIEIRRFYIVDGKKENLTWRKYEGNRVRKPEWIG